MRAAVIGAGFAGLIISRALASIGYDVTLYEEHDRVGYPPHCTGIVSERVVREIGGPARETILASYRGVLFRGGGSEFRVTTSQRIYKLDRERLEELLLEEALSYGVRPVFRRRVKRITADGRLWLGGEEARFDIIILAEGSRRRLLSEALGVKYNPLESVGVNVEVQEASSGEDIIEVGFDEGLSGRGFYWIVPIDGKTVVGALSLDAGRAQRAADSLASKRGGRITRRYGGIVVHGPPLSRNPLGKVIVVGDAAGLNKPLTGGGLYPNSEVARISVESGDVVRAVKVVSGKLRRQHYVAKAILENPGLATLLVQAASEAGFERMLAGRIDFDEHEKLPLAVVKSPHRLAYMLTAIAFRDPRGALSLTMAGLKSLIL